MTESTDYNFTPYRYRPDGEKCLLTKAHYKIVKLLSTKKINLIVIEYYVLHFYVQHLDSYWIYN